jgi:hypothetical protein
MMTPEMRQWRDDIAKTVGGLEGKIETLIQQNNSIIKRNIELETKVDMLDKRANINESALQRNTMKFEGIETKLDENTEATSKILVIIQYGETFFKFVRTIGKVLAFTIKWTARMAGWGMAIWAALYAITHGGKQP